MSLDVTTLALAKSYADQHSGGGGQVQPDWKQNDSTAADYVKNRPGGFYIPGMSAQTITFDGVETGRETIDMSALAGEGVKIVKVSDIGLYPINLEGCAVKMRVGDSEQQVSTFTVSYLTDYGIATLISDQRSNPIILSVVSDYNFHGINIGIGTWFMSMDTIPAHISSLELPDTSGKMLNVNIPAALLDLPRAESEKLGGVKAYNAVDSPNIGDQIVIDSDGFLRYPFKPVTVQYDQSLTDIEKTRARTNIGAGTYSKPSTGIPKADCSAEVQASLDKADSAVQTSQIITLTATLEDGSTKTYKLYGYEVTE